MTSTTGAAPSQPLAHWTVPGELLNAVLDGHCRAELCHVGLHVAPVARTVLLRRLVDAVEEAPEGAAGDAIRAGDHRRVRVDRLEGVAVANEACLLALHAGVVGLANLVHARAALREDGVQAGDHSGQGRQDYKGEDGEKRGIHGGNRDGEESKVEMETEQMSDWKVKRSKTRVAPK